MKCNTVIILVVLAAFTLCLRPLHAINCYKCSRNPGCGVPFDSSAAVSTPGCTSCGTFITVIGGIKYYDRDCAPDTLTLGLVGVDAVSGLKCTTNLCNTGIGAAVNQSKSLKFTFWTLLSTLFAAKQL